MTTGPRRRRARRLPSRHETDLSDQEYALIRELIPAPRPGGRPRRLDQRELINAVLYLVETGAPWRLLPPGFPPWPTVYWYFRRWEREGVWERIHARLLRAGRRPSGAVPTRRRSPSAKAARGAHA
jgi:transposase